MFPYDVAQLPVQVTVENDQEVGLVNDWSGDGSGSSIDGIDQAGHVWLWSKVRIKLLTPFYSHILHFVWYFKSWLKLICLEE